MSLVSFVQGTNFVWEKGEKQAVASILSSLRLFRNLSSSVFSTVSEGNMLRLRRQLFGTSDFFFFFLLYICRTLHLLWAVVKRFFLRITWSQTWMTQRNKEKAWWLGRRSSFWFKLETNLQHSLWACSLLLLSSVTILHVVFNFIAQVLLVPQMMFCSAASVFRGASEFRGSVNRV